MAAMSDEPGHPAPPIVMLDEVDSTNAEALRRAAAGERGPLWICARSQSQGRGRSGRSWLSPPGTLAASFLFEPRVSASALPGLSLVAGVATSDAITETGRRHRQSGLPLQLKWPNDVLIEGAKLSGILIESSSFGMELVAVVGIGINIEARPAIDGRAVTSLAEQGVRCTPHELAAALAAAMAQALALWDRGAGFSSIRAAWLERATAVGTPITVNAGSGPVAGTFAGLDTDGALLLQDTMGIRRRFTFGDVMLAAPAKA